MSFAGMPALKYAMVHSRGDIHKVQRAWTHLFANWLPASGYEPADAPYLELFRDSDDSKGWSILDLDCCVPIRPISR
jgi:predicted transcriptional regulator YdeE